MITLLFHSNSILSLHSVLMAATRDSEYYFVDGNAVFEVESILFKVHRSVMARGSGLSFGKTFSRRSDDSQRNTEEIDIHGFDQSPIHLSKNTTVDEFRALLWSLYALPSDIIGAIKLESIDPIKFINLARIAKRYSFASIEIWALKTLTSYLGAVPLPVPGSQSEPQAVKELSSEMFGELTKVAAVCSHSVPFVEEVMAKWELLLNNGVYLKTAIRVSESHPELRNLHALAYYAMILRERDMKQNLSLKQQNTLLSGHYALFKLWRDHLKSPPQFHSIQDCDTSSECRRHWMSFWNELTGSNSTIPVINSLNLHPLDLLRKLKMAQDAIQGDNRELEKACHLTQKMLERCRTSGKKVLEEMGRETKLKLLDYFKSPVKS